MSWPAGCVSVGYGREVRQRRQRKTRTRSQTRMQCPVLARCVWFRGLQGEGNREGFMGGARSTNLSPASDIVSPCYSSPSASAVAQLFLTGRWGSAGG